MKASLAVHVLACSSILAACGGSSPPAPAPVPAWTPVGAAGFSAGGASSLSFAAGDSSSLYLAYVDAANGDKATVAKYAGVAWSPIGPAGFSAGTAKSTSLCLFQGEPYVAFSDGASSGKATVMKFDGAAWTAVGAAGSSADPVTKIALGTDGTTLYAVMLNTPSGGGGAYLSGMKLDAGSWQTLPGFSGLGNLPSDMSSELRAAGGKLYFAYRDYFGGNYHTVLVSAYDTVGQSVSTVSSTDVTGWVPPALSEYGGVVYWTWAYSGYISFQNAEPEVYRLTPGVAPAQIGTYLSDGSVSSVALGAESGTPYLAYSDSSVSGKAVVKKYASGTWSLVGAKGFSADTANFLQVKVVGGTPYVAFQDGATGKATVMKYQ